MRLLVTGAAGYLGRKLCAALAAAPGPLQAIVAMDVRETPPAERLPGVVYETLDIRAPELGALLARHQIDRVVHLASIVTPTRGCTRQQQYEVDVLGTRNLLEAAVAHGVRHLVVTSSGAAYGYHADNAALLTEDAPLRGHPAFAYADHKRQVEALLADYRGAHPELGQLVLRLSTVLGPDTHNQITDLFEQPVILGLREASSPFCLVWDEDVVACLAAAVRGEATGVYNLTGEGVMTLREIAAALGKRFVPLPADLVRRGLAVLQRRGLTQYGPEQVDFLRYRPVLSSRKLADELGFRPRKTTRQVFALYQQGAAARARRGRPARPAPAATSRPGPAPASTRKVVVITGAAGGIGLALAWRFARDGAEVALLDRDAEALQRALEALRAAGHSAMAEVCDVCDVAACEAAIAAVRRRLGGVDVLINNAGISHRSLLVDTTPAVLHRVMDVNFFGAVHCTRAALDSLLERRGVVVAVSSVAGFAPLIGRTGYAASKHALHGFFDSLRAEVASQGVAVLLVCPSFTDTGIDRHALAGDGGPAGQLKAAVGKLATPDEVAAEVAAAVARRQRLLVLSPVGKAAYWLSRLVPAAYERAMRASVRSEFPV
ncbi:MAG: SDR family oxidoreductase [Deltaproteobacteria bacterium]|nr:SDR family oxidoreductase [Deltaproteobacteria bacterium]